MFWKLELLFVSLVLPMATTSLETQSNATNTDSGCVLSRIDSHLRIAAEFVERARQKVPVDLKELCVTKANIPEKPRDCSEIYKNGRHEDGSYDIFPLSRAIDGPLKVYCDMTKDGGGWTVIQRRGDFGTPTDYFYQGWNSYKVGFGDVLRDFWIDWEGNVRQAIYDEFWISDETHSYTLHAQGHTGTTGNDNIFALTNQKKYQLKFDLTDWEGNAKQATYGEFWISDEAHSYTLHAQQYTGTAGDSFGNHNGYNFTTQDRDNDVHDSNCAVSYKGAWWYKGCYDSNLNGLYYRGEHASYDGVNWRGFKGTSYSLRDTVMKIRPSSF